ncbi:chaperonin 10-like protein [Amylocystis lapponica]|nr:chaperonin 10-like protein [Amylocystis lapponica]
MSLPNTQKAWIVVRKGDPSTALELRPDAPVLTKGEVLIKTQAAALNPVDYKIMKHFPGILGKRPYVAAHDLAGTVVDANGTEFNDGDGVFGLILPTAVLSKHGSLAEYAVVRASSLIPRPANVTPTQAAGLAMAGLTAYQSLFDVGGLEEGQSVFINGGSSAVGSFAIQLAKARGCKVVASASAKNEAYVRALGADEFVDYTKGPLHEALAVGLVDPALFIHSETYLAPSGKFISVGPAPTGVGEFARFVWSVLVRPGWLGGTRRTWKFVSLDPTKEHLQRFTQYIAEGQVKPLVDSVFAFEDTFKAYERILTGRATGKVVVKVDPNVD